ncbi:MULTISPECIES: hypothetical protein [unclassified Bradyrhizobium]|uniref:hypothetical protein n=1 Tax=unclassified Bradyrhizobium TaxID=2631580 RepID=UPI002916FCA8|nr:MULTISPECIES: hypothetical protein [unclassified Bradyrhizobium]
MKFSRLLFALALGLASLDGPSAFAQGANLPWGQQSDQVGWETFVLVTAPSGIPGSQNVEFETWATDEDLYLTNPPKWPAAPSAKVLHPSVLNLSRPRLTPFVIGPGGCGTPGNAKAGDFPASGCIGEEVRRNWASFQYIVGNQLFTRAGLAAAAQKNFVVDMPADSIEVKADWVKISDLKTWLKNALNKDLTDDQVKALYHVNTVNESGVPTDYALVAFHFSSKQIKNWIWSDFEHELNPGRCDDTGCHDNFGAQIKDVPARNSRGSNGEDLHGNQDYGACLKSDAVEQMMKNAGTGSQWRHYCLKGTQIDFVNADGKPSLLGNSVIERIAADVPVLSSSCITCHANAAFKKDGSSNPVPGGPIGPFDPASIAGMVQNDFIWGIFLRLK